MKTTSTIAILSLLGFLAGCSTTTPAYAPQAAPDPIVRGATAKVNIALKPSDEGSQTSIFCRGYGPVSAPDGQTYGSYVVAAENLELQSAGIFDKVQDRSIEVLFKRIDFSTSLGNTVWYIDAEYTAAGKMFAISTTYKDENGSSFLADRACKNVATYLRGATGEHVRQLFQHPNFREFVGITLRQVPPANSNSSIQIRLQQLDSLLKSGTISKSEYDEQRKKIIESL